MSGFLIAIFVILWVVSAINSVRKAVSKAQAAAGGPDAVRAAAANAAAQNEIAARNDAAQRAARVLRSRMQAAVTAAPSASSQKPQMPAYVAPPADQAMTTLINMEAPSMPTFDAPGLDAGSAAYSFGLIGASDNQSAASVFAGRGFLLTEGANAAGAAAIVASAVIGPPVGLRSGPLSASDW
jgi:hypothetical protein